MKSDITHRKGFKSSVQLLTTLVFAVIIYALATDFTYAHHPMGGELPKTLWHGLLSGLGHPIIEFDHLAFVVGAGMITLFAVGYRLILPVFLILGMVIGLTIHLNTITLPFAEFFILLSVLCVGVTILLSKHFSFFILASGFVLAGLFHGYAYAEAIIGAETYVIASYIMGLSLVQYSICLLPALFYFVLRSLTSTSTAKDQEYGYMPMIVGTLICFVAVQNIIEFVPTIL